MNDDQAACSGLRLLTADHVLLGLGRDFILDASRLTAPCPS